MVTLYGISNCDAVRKAKAWFSEHHVAYEFVDYKKHGAPADKLRLWANDKGWEALCNKRGTTWRKLSDAQKAQVVDTESAIAIMVAEPSLIKRPVVESNSELLVGFDAQTYQQHLL